MCESVRPSWGVADVDEILKPSETVCQEAERIVGGDRGPQYGPPTSNFTDTADLWTAYVHAAHPQGWARFTPADVAAMMVLLKLAREAHRPKRDNLVDMIGYCKTLAMVRGYE